MFAIEIPKKETILILNNVRKKTKVLIPPFFFILSNNAFPPLKFSLWAFKTKKDQAFLFHHKPTIVRLFKQELGVCGYQNNLHQRDLAVFLFPGLLAPHTN